MGKKTKGRKRHIVTDIMGNLLCIHVHAANIHDTKSRVFTFEKALYNWEFVQIMHIILKIFLKNFMI